MARIGHCGGAIIGAARRIAGAGDAQKEGSRGEVGKPPPDSLHPYEWKAVAASLKWSPPLLTFL